MLIATLQAVFFLVLFLQGQLTLPFAVPTCLQPHGAARFARVLARPDR